MDSIFETGKRLPRLFSTGLLLLTWLALFSYSLSAQNDSTSVLLKGSLSDIMSQKPEAIGREENISVASQFESGVYEAPGIVTVITDEDIKAGGYRDIMDLLNQIPGFSMASDVQNGLSFGIRGNWAEEAKLLVMLDGMPLNELSYGTFIFGQRVSLLHIKRIEVIRGAGSSKYGGIAALGVINIITRQGQEISGHRLMSTAGFSNPTMSRGVLTYNYGGLLPNNVEITTMGSIREGNLSNMTVPLADSTRASLKDSSKIKGAELYLTLKYKTIKFRQFYEDHVFQSTYEPIFSQNRTTITELEKIFTQKKSDLIVTGSYKNQTPWNTLYGDPAIYDSQNLLASRSCVGATFKTRFNEPFQFLAGGTGYNDILRHQRASKKLSSGKLKQDFVGFSAFAEATFTSKLMNVDAGFRFEHYAYFKPNFAPRLALTKRFRSWHYKLIYNQAYKLPALQNINLDLEESIHPEQLREMQAQVGIHVKDLSVIATYFNTSIDRLIVYGYNTITFTESYINSGNLNNHGGELEISYRNEHFRLSSSYSFNQLLSSSAPEIMRDTGSAKAGYLALPQHKAVARLGFFINERITLNLSYVYESVKEAYVRINKATEEFGQVNYPATHNLNLVLNLDKFIWQNFDLSIGAYNILNSKLSYLYPFNSGYQPLQGMGQELLLNLKIRL